MKSKLCSSMPLSRLFLIMLPVTRRRAVFEDIIKSNNCKRRANDRSEQLKNSLRGYKTMSGSMKRTLQDMGFVITEEGKHYKFIYYGDGTLHGNVG